jgi:hypothetical protein
MPTVNSNTPVVDQRISFVKFKVPKPYSPGHSIDADEANALNDAYARRIAQAVGGDIKELFANEVRKGEQEVDENGQPVERVIEWVDGWSAAKAQSDIVDDFVANFSWNTQRVRDPVEAEMKRLATQAVDNAISRANAKFTAEERKAKIREVLATNDAAFRKVAKKNVESVLSIEL